MEKIIQFSSGIKVTAATRHITSPASYSNASSGLSDIEEKEGISTLSPIYKKKRESPLETAEKNLMAIAVPRHKYTADESEPNSAERK